MPMFVIWIGISFSSPTRMFYKGRLRFLSYKLRLKFWILFFVDTSTEWHGCKMVFCSSFKLDLPSIIVILDFVVFLVNYELVFDCTYDFPRFF